MALDVRSLIDSCALLEEKVAQLYYLFASLFSDMPELAELWRKTAEEEENHMRQFQLAARLARSIAPLSLVNESAVRNAIDTVTMLADKIKQNPPGWQGALKFAIDLEEKLAQFHMDTAAVYTDDSLNTLFKAMMTNDEHHVQSLRNFLEHSGGPAAQS